MANGYQIPPELIPYIIQYLAQQNAGGQPSPEMYQQQAEAGLLDDKMALVKLLLEGRLGQQGDLVTRGEAEAGQAMPKWDTSNIANPGQGGLWLFERLRGEKQAKDARAKMDALLGGYGAEMKGLMGDYMGSAKTYAEALAAQARRGAPPQGDPMAETNRRIDQYSGLNNPLSPIAQAARAARGGQ